MISNALIGQNIDIAEDSSLTTSASNVGGTVTNADTLNLTGGTLNHAVSGAGETYITNDVISNALIGQNIDIAEDSSLTTSASNVGGTVTNADTLNLTGGILDYAVSGGGTTNVTGDVLSNALIEQSINITGQLTSNADNIGGTVTNSNSLILTGGTLNQNVSGIGSTAVTGEVINNAVIGQDVYITETGNLDNNNNIGNVWNSGILTSMAEHLTGTIENNKTLNLSGTLGKTVSGSGVTYVANELTFADGASISNELNLSDGAELKTTGDENSVYSIGVLTGNGDVNLSTGNLTVNRGASLHDLTILNNASGRFLENLTAAGDISNEGSLNVLGNASGVNFTNNGTAEIGGNAAMSGNVLSTGILNVTGNLSGVDITNEGTATVSGNVTAAGIFENTNSMTVYGQLTSQDFTNSGVINIHNGAETENFTNDGEAYITGDLNAADIINNEDKILDVSGNVTANNMTNYGDVDITGNVTLSGILNNYADMDVLGYLIANEINNTGNLNVEYGSNVTVTGDMDTTEDITTSGIINVEGNLSANDVLNDGQLTVAEGADVNGLNNITGGTVDITGDLIVSGALDGDANSNGILNDGSLEVSGNIDAEESITNNSILEVKDSVDADNFTNTDYASIGGSLTSEGDITNTGSQSSIIVSENVEGTNLTNEGTVQIGGTLTAEDTIINENNMTVTGQIISQTTQNDGVLNAYDGVVIDEFTNTNKVVITGNSENVNLDNSGDMDVYGSVIADENIVNTGTLTVTEDVTATGDITNSNVFDITGAVSADDFTNSGDATIEETLTVVNHINNSDDLTVQGHVTAATAENTGIFTVRDGVEFREFTNENTTSITGDAVIGSLTNSNDMNVVGSIVSDTIIQNSGDLDVTNNITANDIANTGVLDVTGNVEAANDVTNSGDTTIGGTLSVTNHLDNSDDLTVQGHVTAATAENTGIFNAYDGVAFDEFTNEQTTAVTGDAIIGSLTNNNDMDVTGSVISDTVIQNTGDLDVTNNVTANDLSNTNTFDVLGYVEANNFTNDAGETNIGEDLTVDNDFVNTGNVTVEGITKALNTNNTGTLQLNNGAVLTNLTNNGTINAYNSFVSNNFNNNSIVNLDNAAIDINAGLNNGNVNVSNSTFNVTGDVTGTNSGGIVDIVDSTVNVTGTLQNQNVTVENSVLNFGLDSDIFNDSVLNVENSRVNTNDGQYTNYNIGELNSSDDSRWSIDIVLNKDEQYADTFTLSEGGSGTIYISTINVGSNVINNCDDNELYILQIIKSAVEDAPQLDYDQSKVLNQATANMTSDIIIARDFGLATTDTKNDSIEIRGWQDTFGAWADLDVDEDKSFTFVPDTNYILSRDVTEIQGNKMDIFGNNITFNINGYEFLNTVHEGQDLTISDITIDNTSGTITNEGTLTYNNVTFTDKDVVNNNIFNLNGNININNVTNTGDMGIAANVNMNEFNTSGNVKGSGVINANNVVNSGYFELDGTILSDSLANNTGGVIYTGDISVNTITNDGSLTASGNLISKENVLNTGTMNITGNVISKEMTNDGSADIHGSVGLDNIINNNKLNIDSDLVIDNLITNTGDMSVGGSTSAEEIQNSNLLNIDGNLLVNTTITNSGDMSVEGSTSVEEISNTGSLSFGNPDLIPGADAVNNPADVPAELVVNNITNDGTLTLNNTKLVNVDKISVSDEETKGNLNLYGSYLQPAGNIENQNIAAYNNSRIDFTDPYKYINNNLSLNSSTLNLGALTLESLELGTVEMNNGTINIASSDVDFHQHTMGKLTIDEYIKHGENSAIHLNAVNILNVPDMSQRLININFADMSFADQVQYHGRDTVYTPMYMYGASYDYHTGDMVFARGGFYDPDSGQIIGPSNPSDAFSPSVLVSSVSSQVGAKATMDQVYNYAFQHSDNYMAMPSLRRSALLNRNKYAIVDGTPVYKPYEEANMWFKPYVSFGNIPLHDGPDVSVTTYGSLIGYDSELKEIGDGWSRAFTGYIGYTGANLSYRGISSIQNGGLLGGTMTLYKGNLFNATTVSTGAIVSDVSTPYGNDRPTMLLAGVANKTGYNFEFKDGLFIIQPNFLLSYTFVNTFDYVNSSGINMSHSPLHSITVSPGVRFIANTKNGWQPYIGANFVWNIFDISKVTAESAIAGNARLPEMSIDPYIQYGIGVQKLFKDNFMAFGQTMIQNGGRTGVSISLGMRWVTGYGNEEYLIVPELILDTDTLDGQRIIDISDKKKLNKKQSKNADKQSVKFKKKKEKDNAIVTPLEYQNRSFIQYTEGSNQVFINPGMKITPDKKSKSKNKQTVRKTGVKKATAAGNASKSLKNKKQQSTQNNVIRLNYLSK